MIPVFPTIEAIPRDIRESINIFFNNSSGRRVLSTTSQALISLPHVIVGVIFAEEVPEKHAIALYAQAKKLGKTLIGPASVGLLIPGKMKVGAIGGVDVRQILRPHLLEPGNIAVFSSSGGMTNELINIIAISSHRISFSLSFGGDRFPLVTPLDGLLAAQKDSNTDAIVYFGELGGYDEYELAKAIRLGKVTKTVVCYIAGSVSDMFATPPQFGHAKAMAEKMEERALTKRKILKDAGAFVADSFTEFVEMIKNLPYSDDKKWSLFKKSQKVINYSEYAMLEKEMTDRTHALIATTVSSDRDGKVVIMGEDLLIFAKSNSFAKIVGTLFLGKKIRSKETERFIDFVLKLLVDHGPYVSGAVNTIITARAGKDLVSSLAAGLLTVGPRFGGAINTAAGNWLQGVRSGKDASSFVETFALKGEYISGIGHKKYRVDLPDPRVKELLQFAPSRKQFTNFAKNVEKITIAKKGNLILNVDGGIAAVLLDLLMEKEGLQYDDLERLVHAEFFNALFILSRSVGFIAHFLDQKRLDEGLFRLGEDQVADLVQK